MKGKLWTLMQLKRIAEHSRRNSRENNKKGYGNQ